MADNEANHGVFMTSPRSGHFLVASAPYFTTWGETFLAQIFSLGPTDEAFHCGTACILCLPKTFQEAV